jgi:hypothetical protein
MRKAAPIETNKQDWVLTAIRNSKSYWNNIFSVTKFWVTFIMLLLCGHDMYFFRMDFSFLFLLVITATFEVFIRLWL